MSLPSQPTLLFPNGGEDILTRDIKISWINRKPISNDGFPVFYEIFYSEDYDYTNEPNWIMIANIPSDVSNFIWKVGNKVKGNNVRVAIDAVNIMGERTGKSISAGSFTLRRETLTIPAVLSPLPNSSHGNNIDITFDSSAIRGTFSERAKYYIYYGSNKLNIPLTPVATRITTSTPTVMWNVSTLPPSDDYELTVYLADDDNRRSPEVKIRNINIVNEGFFIIDTKPPVGVIKINNGNQFTKERDVLAELFAFDESTGIHSLQFLQEDDNSNSDEGPAESFATKKFLRLLEEDGEKTVKVIFQDFAGNRSSEIGRNFRQFFDVNNQPIADMAVNPDVKNELWTAVNEEQGNSSIYLIDNIKSSFINTISDHITSLAFYSGELYIGADTVDNTAKVYKRTVDNNIILVFTLTEFNTEVVSMVQFGDDLFIGTSSGELFKFDGSSVSLVNKFSSTIKNLDSDGTLLFILLNNSQSIFVFDGINFTEATA